MAMKNCSKPHRRTLGPKAGTQCLVIDQESRFYGQIVAVLSDPHALEEANEAGDRGTRPCREAGGARRGCRMNAEATSFGEGYRIATAPGSNQVVVQMDAGLAMAVGDQLFKALPGSESVATIRAQFAADLASAGFTVLMRGKRWPADIRAFVQSHVLASAQEGN